MMMQIVWISILSASFLIQSTMAMMSEETADDLEKKARFHLNEFKRSLLDIRALHRNSDVSAGIQSRSLNGQDAWKRLADHVLAFCEDIKKTDSNMSLPVSHETFHARQPKDAVKLSIDNYHGTQIQSSEGDTRIWSLPALRPISVAAERIDNKVIIIFDILHNGTGVVARYRSFQFARVDLTPPPNITRPYISRVQFVTDASPCKNNKFEFQEQYEFMEPTLFGDLETTANIQLDICGFDKYQNMSLGEEERKWETHEGVIKEDVKYPTFRVISGRTADFVLNPGQNETFIFEFHSDGYSYLKASVNAYDYIDESWHGNTAIVSYDGIPYTQAQILNLNMIGHADVTTFFLEIVNQTHFQTSSVVKGEVDTWNLNLTLRLTLPVADKQWSGMLSVNTYKTAPNFNVRGVVRKVKMDRNWHFTSPGNPYPPPAMEPILIARDTRCTTEGNRKLQRDGPNCTVSCAAFGEGITNISLSGRNHENAHFPHSRSVSFVLGNKAFTMIDVGPASLGNDKTNFTCSIKGDFGSKRKKITLHRIVFPTFLINESHIIQLDKETSEVKCTATSTLPMKIVVEIATVDGHATILDHTRLESDVRNASISGNTMTLIYHLPTASLRYPKEILTCEANNRYGMARKSFSLEDVIPNYRRRDKP